MGSMIRVNRDKSGTIYSIQRYCVHDGPGIRTTVFFKGCPLGCVWCHNPESIAPEPELLVYENRCVHCGRCVEVCPERSRQEGSEPVRCRACGRCAEACPAEARRIAADFGLDWDEEWRTAAQKRGPFD